MDNSTSFDAEGFEIVSVRDSRAYYIPTRQRANITPGPDNGIEKRRILFVAELLGSERLTPFFLHRVPDNLAAGSAADVWTNIRPRFARLAVAEKGI